MKLLPEQISQLRKDEEQARASLANYSDYLESREITSSDYSARALIGDSLTDQQYHMERDYIKTVSSLLLESDYVTTRTTDHIDIGTKFIIKYDDDEETSTLMLTEGVFGLSRMFDFISIESPVGKAVIGKKPNDPFQAVVVTGKTPRDRRIISGKVVDIITDPKAYLHFIREKKIKYRMCDAASRMQRELLEADTEEARQEYESLHTITVSQRRLLLIEFERLSRVKNNPSVTSRLANIKKLLTTSKVAIPPQDGTIGVGSTFDIVITDGETSETRHYEMINRAVSDELEDGYVERIDTLGSKLYGKRPNDIIKYRKDGKTYQVAVMSVDIKDNAPQTAVSSSYQYTKK